jgi:hypothetical protein
LPNLQLCRTLHRVLCMNVIRFDQKPAQKRMA